MREISKARQAQIGALVTAWWGSSVCATWMFAKYVSFAGSMVTVGFFFFVWFLFGVAGYRILMALIPLRPGDLKRGSKEEWVFQVVQLPFHFFLFDPIVRSGILPTPFSGLVYRLFGARIGNNTYPGHCTIFDPIFVQIGNSVNMGHQATLVPHVMEGDRTGCFPIRIEDGATIGVNAVVLAGVTIAKGAVVAAGAVVPKFTRIGPNEVWAGLPARRIGFLSCPSEISKETPPKKEAAGEIQ